MKYTKIETEYLKKLLSLHKIILEAIAEREDWNNPVVKAKINQFLGYIDTLNKE